jgi:hypothetical protein
MGTDVYIVIVVLAGIVGYLAADILLDIIQ